MFIIFFFFQAEDGIRDKLVTGVQTCALPILWFHDIGFFHLLAEKPYITFFESASWCHESLWIKSKMGLHQRCSKFAQGRKIRFIRTPDVKALHEWVIPQNAHTAPDRLRWCPATRQSAQSPTELV